MRNEKLFRSSRVIGALAVAAMLLSGCDGGTTTPSSSASPAQTVVQSPAPTGQAAADLFRDMSAAMAAQQTMRATMTSEKQGTVTTSTIEFIKPDRLASRGGQAGDTILIGKDVYLKQQEGSWTKLPVSINVEDLLSQATQEEMFENVDVQNLRTTGIEFVGTKPCWVYEYDSTTTVANITLQTRNKVWVGMLDKLSYKTEAITQSSQDPAGVTTTTTMVYEYGIALTIEAPI